MIEQNPFNPNHEMSPSKRAKLLRELGKTGAYFGDNVEDTRHLPEGGQHQLPAETEPSKKSKAERAADYLNQQIDKNEQ